MSKLLEDPKVAALVVRQVAAAVKSERKRVLEVVKSVDVKSIEDKAAQKAAKAVLTEISAAVKAV
jgi:hypothetical protein